MKSVYETHAVRAADFTFGDWRGWEWLLKPQERVFYLRRHLSGPVTVDPRWELIEARP